MATTSVIGPDDTINSYPDITSSVDYEGELAVIIGKRGSNIAAEDAMKYVYGYTIINDVTARDLQKKHAQWFRGKSLIPSARWDRPSWWDPGRCRLQFIPR